MFNRALPNDGGCCQRTKSLSPRQKPTISIVGAGRLGQAFAVALQQCGYPISALVARHQQKAEKAARNLTNPTLALSANRLAELPATELVLISTPDDVIEELAVTLADLNRSGKGRVVLHTSGALSSQVLAPLAKKGFQTGSLHPLVSVSEPLTGARALHRAFFCVEGSLRAKGLAKAIVLDLGGRSFTIATEKKTLYHTAALTASPQLTALFDIAVELLSSCGLTKKQAQRVFMPLLESTVNNLKTSTPQAALTGTFARGDVETVRRHIKALSGNDLAEVLQIYKLLGKHSLELAKKNGLDPARVKQIENLLG